MLRKKWGFVPAIPAGLCVLIALLYMAVISFAFSPTAYPQEMPYGEMADELTAYLSGHADALSDSLFTQRERLHMEDVLALFEGGARIARACLWAGAALALSALLLGGRRRLGRGLLYGCAAFALLVAALGLWALLDFEGWFTRMHEMVFTNDLWLLDPAESMLIRMLPLDFFIQAVKTIVFRFLIGQMVFIGLAVACTLPRRKKESPWTIQPPPPAA